MTFMLQYMTPDSLSRTRFWRQASGCQPTFVLSLVWTILNHWRRRWRL